MGFNNWKVCIFIDQGSIWFNRNSMINIDELEILLDDIKKKERKTEKFVRFISQTKMF